MSEAALAVKSVLLRVVAELPGATAAPLPVLEDDEPLAP